MNVYEAVATSPIGVAWHNEKEILARNVVADVVRANPDGWQPLYTSPAEYTLGEPLTEVAHERQHYIAVNKKDGRLEQGTFEDDFLPAPDYWTYYADPRPWPVLPKKKPRYKVETCYLDSGRYWLITKDGKRYAEMFNRANAEEMVKHLNEIEEQKK